MHLAMAVPKAKQMVLVVLLLFALLVLLLQKLHASSQSRGQVGLGRTIQPVEQPVRVAEEPGLDGALWQVSLRREQAHSHQL